MGFISNDREQGHLLGYSLSELVPKDAKCRFIVSMVGRLNLQELYNRYSEQGNDAFEPSIMLATWFFAYAEGLTSTRRLEELCKRDLHYVYVSALLRPDHTSLSRFRQRHVDLLPQYFQQIVTLALEEGISDFKVISIDGTKVQAASSFKHMKNHKALAQYLDHVRNDIGTFLQQCDQDDAATDKRQELEAKAQLLEQRLNELEQRQSTLKPEHQQAHQIHLLEPDACLMQKVNGSQSLPAYNGQLSVDATSHLIVACELVTDRNDRQQFQRQHQLVERTLQADPQRRYVADAGYHTKEQLAYINEHQINAVIADPTPVNRSIVENKPVNEEQLFRRSNFVYDSETDSYRCPAGF